MTPDDDSRAFTLIEILVTTLILVTGLAAVAGLFSQGAQSNLRNRQRVDAEALLETKIAELKSGPNLTPGDSAEYLSIRPDGTIAIEDSKRATYLRTATISNDRPKQVTVIIYGRQNGRGTMYRELLRATSLVADGF